LLWLDVVIAGKNFRGVGIFGVYFIGFLGFAQDFIVDTSLS
jgi:hypothetical protein